ncbi:PhzF family phenazine biosynthesis protein [Sphingomonas sp. Leaf407]|uniref:PhzF family phenazine biosynthesis protein n=1 Tax=unclassified Sphingomonas TaxID=196159 RepID=UPI0006FCFCE9|nr:MULTISPECIES: PhzF family phenazine biosynthesis protein [unclassified Sphingomonas]KQN35721.1 PhzF family phenazine biosynthesis protein [Sphingomonas sp. Leaf42]KQT26589.1 PhzF family phenazine biosynthesis protein [Sphingomonas sp. Leaf407]
MTLPFTVVDAFADRPFTGNPAAVMVLTAWPDDALLRDIAAEHNLSETAFAVATDDADADYDLRWFTPTVEIAMCGHATLASGHVLIGERDEVRFATRKAGVLTVARDGAGYTLDLPVTRVAAAPDPALLAALGCEGEVFASISGAQATSIILLPDAAAVRGCAPDMRALAACGVMAIITAPGDVADVVSRVFVPTWGVDEDPVTGSAHAALAPFWAERLGREHFTAFQASARGGHLTVTLAGERAVLGGGCVTVMRGELLV